MSTKIASGVRMATRSIGAALLLTFMGAPWMAPSARSADVEPLRAGVKKIIEDLTNGCRGDFKSYCSSVTPGEGRLAFCLVAHADKRSPQCESALSIARREAETLMKQYVESCEADIAFLCSGTKPGEGRIAQCLLDHRASLSQPCGEVADIVETIVFPASNPEAAGTSTAAIPGAVESSAPAKEAGALSGAEIINALDTKVAGIIDEGKQGCASDLEKYCSSVTPGEGRLAFCLTAHADKRTPACESALAVARSEAESLIDEVDRSIQACSPDIAALCAGTTPGDGRIAQCLLEQRDALSSSCGQVLDKLGNVIFPPRNQAVADRAGPAETTSEAQPKEASAPSGADIIAALDTKVAGIIEKGKQGCAADLETYCSSVTPGEGRLAFCLTAHADKRTLACESALAVARSEAETLISEVDQSIQACVPDIASLCAGTRPGEGRIAQCLLEQREALSSNCGEVLDKLDKVIFPPRNKAADASQSPGTTPPESTKEATAASLSPAGKTSAALVTLDAKVQGIIEKGKQGCAADLETYCSSVTPGEGRLAFCLTAHADKRSAACESALGVARSEAEMLITEVNQSIEACSPDIAALCSGTEPGEGRIAQCLADQRDMLTKACGQVVDVVGKVVFAPRNQPAVVQASPSGNAQITTGAVNPVPAAGEKACRTVEASVTDWGQDATKQDARNLLKKQVGAFVAKRGLKDYTAGSGVVACSADLNLLVAGYYSCKAKTQVCWSAETQQDAGVKKE
jgi:Golgi apparatus protein 1